MRGRKFVNLSLLLIFVVSFATAVAPVHAAAPTITQVDAQVTVLEDSQLDIKYRLTFAEVEPRDKITQMGPFDAGHQIISAHLEHAGQQTPVSMKNLGGGFYSPQFDIDTQAGAEYTLEVRYRVDRYLDTTVIEGKDYKVLAWAPIEWSLPIGEQIVRFILPIELPADVTEAEQVTDELVDQTELTVEQKMVETFDRWVYYSTPDEASGKNWLSVYISKKNVPPEYHFNPKIYLPATYFAVIPTPIAEVEGGLTAPTDPVAAPSTPILPFFCCFSGMGLFLAGAIFALIKVIPRKKELVEEYAPPEIEIETFEREGVVPDLDAIEAALYIGNSAKVLTLVIMSLEQRGVVSILNRKPLQLEVPKADAPLEDYEKTLVEGIAPDGTIPQAVIDAMLKQISQRLRKKMWNADSQRTRETYNRRADEAWETYERWEPARRERYDEQHHPWVILSRNYRPYPAERREGKSLAETVSESQLGRSADYMATRLEAAAATVATGMESLATSTTGMIDRLMGKPVEELGHDACHAACYAACHSACVHDACHSACVHDACHSACHSACDCHSACHSACHGACVSSF